MKSLLEFISESISEDKNVIPVLGLIDELDLDFSSIKGSDKFDLAKKQEQYFADELKKVADEYEILTVQEYCEKKKIKYSAEVDSKTGDIIIYKGRKIACCIDLKVSTSKNMIGTPTMLSLANFHGTDTHYYVCSNIDGSDIKVINANSLYEYITSKKGEVKVSKERKDTYPQVKALFGKVNLVGKESDDLSKLYNEDFVSTNAIKEYLKK